MGMGSSAVLRGSGHARRAGIGMIDMGSRCLVEQLRLEEALLRTDTRNFALVNRVQASERSVVLGTNGDVNALVELTNAVDDGVRLIRRFSGGGTVFADRHMLCVSFVCCASDIGMSSWPRPIMHWTQKLYHSVFKQCSSNNEHSNNARNTFRFSLRENDYCFDERKFGGNAQSISGDRFVHHTSFLWDCNTNAMQRYLKMPTKRPAYRADRSHAEFVCSMKDAVQSEAAFVDAIRSSLQEWFDVQEMKASDVEHATLLPHRCGTHVLDPIELLEKEREKEMKPATDTTTTIRDTRPKMMNIVPQH